MKTAPFRESIKLLRDLADLQNGAPLEKYRQEWEKTMKQVYNFLNRWENQQLCECDTSLIHTGDKGGEYCAICQKDLE